MSHAGRGQSRPPLDEWPGPGQINNGRYLVTICILISDTAPWWSKQVSLLLGDIDGLLLYGSAEHTVGSHPLGLHRQVDTLGQKPPGHSGVDPLNRIHGDL